MPGKSKKLAGPVDPTRLVKAREDTDRWDRMQATNDRQAQTIDDMTEYITMMGLLQDFSIWRDARRQAMAELSEEPSGEHSRPALMLGHRTGKSQISGGVALDALEGGADRT